MAANFQNMGGAGQMMPQQMQQQQQQQQGRPQQQQVASAQIQQLICTALQSQQGPASGWQTQTLLQERLGLVYNIIGNLRLASQNQQNPPTLQKMCEIGLKFERDIFEKSPDKAHYKLEVQNKLNQLLERRNQNHPNLQQSINAQAQAQQQAQSQQMMMNQNNGMQGQVPRNIPQQPQQGFHHLQHQMQASPLPGQQMTMGMPNQGMPPNMTPNQQQQFQMAMQQRAQQQPQQHQNGPARPQQNGTDKFTNEELARVNELCSRMMAEASEEDKIHLRNNLQQRMNPGVHQRYLAQNVDPLQMYYRNQAQNRVKEERQRAQAHAQAQAQFANSQQPPNMPVAAPAMQQQRSMQPSPMNGPQPQVPGGGNPDFGSFTMENIIGQQQQAGVMAQEAGQMVVPVSGSQRNGTPQPGGMPGQPMNVMDQRSLSNNPNASRQQQQQILNAQQQQQQRLQHAALQQSQQSQAQIRANSQAKAQQIALHGQPGGMGPGPVPPQQSPAMNTLNTPLRTPSQQMNHVEPLHANPNAQFGQALDARFNNQVDQRQLGAPNTLLQSMLRELSTDRQQQLQSLPPDKLNEVVTRWHQQRQQGLQAGQQAGRPMQMPGNNQVRPGQPIPQPGQFNPQNPANQFMIANQPGQRTAQGGMSQQQQMLLQQQMAKVQQQQRSLGQVPNEQQQRLAIQLDNLEFPQGMLAHPSMPRQIPPELKKWGQIKQWAMQNQLGAEIMENIKKLQGLHYQNIIRQRNQHQQTQAVSAPGGPQGVPGQAPMVPPGMAAPVAPMGQNPMQVANGMSMPGPGQAPVLPTQEQIQQLRQHPTGKMAGATDDQIRQLLMRMQAGQTPQQQQQLRHNQMMHMQQMQMANQAPMHGQQARPNPPQGQQNANPLVQAQSMPAQKSQQKTQAPAEQTSNRGARPPTNGRSATQNSSPAQPAKNLKRASSDVVEVPNPNLPQHQRPPNQQSQGQSQASQPPRPANFVNMSPQNLASLDPEARKRYEMSRVAQKANPATEQMLKLKSIAQEEEQRAREPVADLEMDSETKQAVASRVKEVAAPLKAVGSAIARWYQLTHDDQRARLFFRSRHRLAKQFRDPIMTQLKENFSIQLGEVDQIKGMLRTMLKDLSDNFPEMFKNKGAPQTANSQPAAAPAGQTMQAASVPLNAANLQQQQQQLSKMEQRSGSRGGGQTPAAPTSTQPPFHFGASSPHGQPAYIGKAGLTQDNLHIPARKKQKPNASAPGQTTPSSNTSPLVKKGTSPEVLKQQAPAQQAQQKAPLVCTDPECERNNTTFNSEEALHRHRQEEHIKIENPMQFAMDSLSSMLGVDPHGRPANVTGPELAAPSTAVNMTASGSKQGQTPNMKTGTTPIPVATPMNRQGSTTENKPNGPPKSKPDLSKNTGSKTQDDSAKQQSTMQAPETSMDAWANCTIDPNRLLETFHGFETGAGGAISDLNVYRSLTPNDTPESSKDSGVSEPNSDISDGVALDINLSVLDDNWQPFGPSDAEQLFNHSGNYNVDMDGGMDMLIFDDDKPITYFEPLDNFDTSQFDKPFAFDTSLFSMNSE